MNTHTILIFILSFVSVYCAENEFLILGLILALISVMYTFVYLSRKNANKSK